MKLQRLRIEQFKQFRQPLELSAGKTGTVVVFACGCRHLNTVAQADSTHWIHVVTSATRRILVAECRTQQGVTHRTH